VVSRYPRLAGVEAQTVDDLVTVCAARKAIPTRSRSSASFAVETTFSSRRSESIERTLLNWFCW